MGSVERKLQLKLYVTSKKLKLHKIGTKIWFACVKDHQTTKMVFKHSWKLLRKLLTMAFKSNCQLWIDMVLLLAIDMLASPLFYHLCIEYDLGSVVRLLLWKIAEVVSDSLKGIWANAEHFTHLFLSNQYLSSSKHSFPQSWFRNRRVKPRAVGLENSVKAKHVAKTTNKNLAWCLKAKGFVPNKVEIDYLMLSTEQYEVKSKQNRQKQMLHRQIMAATFLKHL